MTLDSAIPTYDVYFGSFAISERFYKREEYQNEDGNYIEDVVQSYDKHTVTVRHFDQLLPIENLLDFNVADGLDDTDDTCSLSFVGTFEDLKWSINYAGFKEYQADSIFIGINGILFGPYDIESNSYNKYTLVTSLSGRKDRWLNSSVLYSFSVLTEKVNEFLLSPSEPYKTWRELLDSVGLSTEIVAANVVGGAADGGIDGARGSLGEWGLTFSPAIRNLRKEIVNNVGLAYTFIREPKIQSLYPSIDDSIYFSRYIDNTDSPSNRLHILPELETTPYTHITETVNNLSIQHLDIYNKPEDYKTRRIDIAVDSMILEYSERLLYSYGTDLTKPPVIIDSSALSDAFGLIAADTKRWELQNSAETISFDVPLTLNIAAGNYITIDEQSGFYRVISINHSISSSGGYLTSVECALYQGPPLIVRDTASPPGVSPYSISPLTYEAEVVLANETEIRAANKGRLKFERGEPIAVYVSFKDKPIRSYGVLPFKIFSSGANANLVGKPILRIPPGTSNTEIVNIEVTGDTDKGQIPYVIALGGDITTRDKHYKVNYTNEFSIKDNEQLGINYFISYEPTGPRVYLQGFLKDKTNSYDITVEFEYIPEIAIAGTVTIEEVGKNNGTTLTIPAGYKYSRRFVSFDAIVRTTNLKYTARRLGAVYSEGVLSIDVSRPASDNIYTMENISVYPTETSAYSSDASIRVIAHEPPYNRQFVVYGAITGSRQGAFRPDNSTRHKNFYKQVYFRQGAVESEQLTVTIPSANTYTGDYLAAIILVSFDKNAKPTRDLNYYAPAIAEPRNRFERKPVSRIAARPRTHVSSKKKLMIENVLFIPIQDIQSP